MLSSLRKVISKSSSLILSRVAITSLLVENLEEVLVINLRLVFESKAIAYACALVLIGVKFITIIIILKVFYYINIKEIYIYKRL